MTQPGEEWIQRFGLQPHPEGGWFRETYRSADVAPAGCLPERFGQSRPFSTAILYLLQGDQFSAFHRLQSDEVWHFYAGRDLILTLLAPGQNRKEIRLGSDPETGAVFQTMIPAGVWFAACLSGPDGYALVGCTVSPGFDYADFELANRADLLADFPQERELIERLTRDENQ